MTERLDVSVLLINLPVCETGSIRSRAVYPPLGIAYVAAVLKSIVKSVTILDAPALGLSAQEIIDEIDRRKPDFVGMTVFTIQESTALEICKAAKRVSPSTRTILGGSHIFHLHEEVMAKHHTVVDFCVRGEGEVTVVELMQALYGDRSLDSVDGLTFWSGDQVVVNRPRQLIKNLDVIPFPARELLPNEKYRGIRVLGGGSGEFTAIMASRGCPYTCNYCSSAVEWQRRVRFRSVDNVIAEMLEVSGKYGIRYVRFNDDLFTMKADWVMEFCQKYQASGLSIRWVCDARVETVTPRMLEAMKKAGCAGVFFGIEFGNERIRLHAGKQFTTQRVYEAVRAARNAGVPTYGLFMIGYPGEDRETINETIDLSVNLGLDWAGFCVVTPLPGTPLYEYCKEHNKLKTYNWAEYDIIDGRSVIAHDKLEEDDIPELHSLAYRRFYFRPSYVLMRLLKIRSWRDMLFALGVLSDLLRARFSRSSARSSIGSEP